jgi:hypothetical protein
MKTFRTHRFWTLWASALAIVGWYYVTDPNGGAETLARLQWLAWIIVAAGPAYLLRRAFMDNARSCDAYSRAMQSPTGAGLVFIGLCLLTGLLFLATAGQARADTLPVRAATYLPMLAGEIDAHWPDAPMRSVLGGQVEQETCPSLKHWKCWNPAAELKMSREYGFGLGQLTVTPRFDNFAEARKLHASLRDWQFADRFDPARQLRTMVLMDRAGYRRLTSLVTDERERLAMALSAYNGGLGGVLQDRRLCAAVKGCEPGRWFGHVERHSLKAKAAAKGYGKSFYEINREYVRNIMTLRAPRYLAALG